MPDQSHLDQRYFVDSKIYNCPFCNRRHVAYSIVKHVEFDWTDEKRCRVFFVKCHSCYKESMHLTFRELDMVASNTAYQRWHFNLASDVDEGATLDDAMFYSVPTSFFVLDVRVPRVLRDLLTEAEGCLKSNFLTGASACARKIVYELAQVENATGDSYEDRIKSLKSVHPEVEPTYFDTLLTIQQLTSTKVHENSYDGWEARHLRIILAALSEVLHELYVLPAVRDDRRKAVLALQKELGGEKAITGADDGDCNEQDGQ
ncbi:MAG: hypothetical protein F4Y61_03335 [Rhodothermaceae bacterium]|nr:hypothetical protein [Rhodothermaceae bacterium]